MHHAQSFILSPTTYNHTFSPQDNMQQTMTPINLKISEKNKVITGSILHETVFQLSWN